LLADSVSPIFDGAIGHDSGLVNVSPEYSAIKVDPSKISSSKDTVGKSSTFQEGIGQVSISQISPTKTGRDQTSPTQISPTQISPIQVGLNQADTPDGSRLDSTLYPYDLMNTSLKPGVRKLPSAMDWAIINALNSGVGSGVSGVGTVNPAHLTADALIGITNGDFTTPTTWNTAGATNIINGTATLTEQSQKLSELTQAFIIPTGAKTSTVTNDR
jgi:hypothetical protein